MSDLIEYKCPACGGAMEFNTKSQKLKCPYCDTEMHHGYLNCGTTIWRERKHKVSLFPDGKERYALHLKQPLMSPNQIESHCCPKCKRIIIDATDYENNLA